MEYQPEIGVHFRHFREMPLRPDLQLMDQGTPTCIHDRLAYWARKTPDAPAVIAPGRQSITYKDLFEQACCTVETLNAAGFGRASRIGISLAAGPEWPVALISLMSGFTCVPVNPDFTRAELQTVLTLTGCSAILTQPERVPHVVEAANDSGIQVIEFAPSDDRWQFRFSSSQSSTKLKGGFAGPDDVAAIFTTSGTTSSVKRIPLTQYMIAARAFRARRFVDLEASDRCLDLMPSFHGGAMLISILGTMFAGAGSIYPGATSPSEFETRVRDLKPTWCALPPPLVEALANTGGWSDGRRPEGLRAFFTCGAPILPKNAEAVESRFQVPLQNSYGATECGGVTALPMPPGPRRKGSVGVSIGLALNVLDSGEIVVRGPGVFNGYEGTASAEEIPSEGDWYRTGDQGYIDADGFLFLTGRMQEWINRGGEKIAPGEVERVLRLHEAIMDAAVFPLPHDSLGQEAAAAVVACDHIHPATLRRFASRHLASFKVPRLIILVAEIPRSAAGKLQRNRLAEHFASELAAARLVDEARFVAPRTTVEIMLAEIWARVLRVEKIGIHDRFLDYGGDSLTALSIISEVQRKLGRTISPGLFWNDPTIAGLSRAIVNAEFSKSSPLVTVQRSGEHPLLFCVLPGWFIPELERLSRYLGEGYPVYGLVPDTRPGAGQSGMGREEVLAACIEAIESIPNSDPCFLIGRSSAGLVAFELARRLRNLGRSVLFVGLLDTHYPGITRHRLLPFPLQHLEFILGELVKIPRSKWAGHVARLPTRGVRRWWRRRTGRRSLAVLDDLALDTRLHRVFDEVPKPMTGRVVLFAAEDSRHRGFLDRRLYWSQAAEDGLEVHLLPGDHNLMFQEPHIRSFAAVLKRCIDGAAKQAGTV